MEYKDIQGKILRPRLRKLLSPREDCVDFVDLLVPTSSEQTGVRSSHDRDVPLYLDSDSSQLLRRLRERLQRYDVLPLSEGLPLKPLSVSDNGRQQENHDKKRR